jgi:hypothetical protein
VCTRRVVTNVQSEYNVQIRYSTHGSRAPSYIDVMLRVHLGKHARVDDWHHQSWDARNAVQLVVVIVV